jgi:hypothetical protein
MVESLLGDDYNLLRGMDEHLGRFLGTWQSELAPSSCAGRSGEALWTNASRPWWKRHKWGNQRVHNPILTQTTIEFAEEILDPLRRCMEMYRDYLRTFTMFKSAPKSAEDFWLRNICVQVGRIVELVHRFDNLDERSSNSSTIKSRSDWLGLVIYEVRNKAAHYNPDYIFTKPFVQVLLLTMLYWLSLCVPSCEPLPDDALVQCIDRTGHAASATFEEKAAIFFVRALGRHNCTAKDPETLRNGYVR